MWTRDVQNAVGTLALCRMSFRLILIQTFAVVLCGWLGGFGGASEQAQPGRLLTIEEVGQILEGMLLGHDAVHSPKPESIF